MRRSCESSCCYEHGVTRPVKCSCKRLLFHPDVALQSSSSSDSWQQEREPGKDVVICPDTKYDIFFLSGADVCWFTLTPFPKSSMLRNDIAAKLHSANVSHLQVLKRSPIQSHEPRAQMSVGGRTFRYPFTARQKL